jgi:hypothetical protein
LAQYGRRFTMRLLSRFLRRPGEFLQAEHTHTILIISLCSLLFVCILLTMAHGVTRPSSPVKNSDVIPALATPGATQTKWWVRKDPTPTLAGKPRISTAADTSVRDKCPAYAAFFKPGTFGSISLSPPYESLLRSGAGKNYSRLGYIEVGGGVKILDFPVCTDDGYVWLKVQSDDRSSGWTAGGRNNGQWVLPCSDPSKQCTGEKQTWPPTSMPRWEGSDPSDDRCVSDTLAVGLDARVSPDDILVVRTEPYTGSVLGHISPAAVVTVIEGPECEGGTVWWKVTSKRISGWAVENLLKACSKDGDCRNGE